MKPRHWVLGGTIALTVLSFVAAGIVRSRSHTAWSAMQVAVRERAAERTDAPEARQPLWGEPQEGLAFEHYGRALALAQELGKQDHERLIALLPHGREDLPEATDELRRRWRPALLELRAGARCRDRNRPPSTGNPEADIANLLAARHLANMAVVEARALRGQGRHLEAVRWTLDAAALGVDLQHRGILINQMIGSALLAIATMEAWPDAAVAALSSEARAALGEGLTRADRQFDPRLDLHGELAFVAHSLEAAGPELWQSGELDGWRYGFSARWMAADAYLRLDAMADLLLAGDEPWPTRKAELAAWTTSAAGGGNPFLQNMLPNLESAERNLRLTLTHVRLLRVAVALHGGDALELSDPLASGPLAITREGDRARVASQGRWRDAPLARTVARLD